MKKLIIGAALAAASSLAFPAAAQQQAPARAASPSSADARLKALYDAVWSWRQKEYGGEEGGFPRVDEASQKRRLAYLEKALADLERIPVDQLSAEERLNAAVFRTSLEGSISDLRFREWEMPFNSDSNFWASLGQQQSFKTAEEYRRYIKRLKDLPRYFDEQMANMRAGLKRGFSVPRATLAGRESSIETYATTDLAKNPFYTPFANIPATIPAAEQAQIRAEGEAAVQQSVVPAYTKLLNFFRGEYVPKARTTLAAEAMPDGKAFYAAQIREYTTLGLTADEIHQIGLKEVARIEAEMGQVMRAAKFNGTLPQFLAFLKSDPQFYAKTPDELMGFSSYVAKRVDGKLKDYFNFLPRYRFTIRPVPDAIAPYYTAGRGGLESCWMNTYNLPARPLYQIPALTLHECAPGHSFQAALALEQPKRPDFRRQTYFSGYGEGWGLYTEYLGKEMGIYRTPYEDFGRLSYEMWRAARLVIDTGLHSKGWTRQQALDYLGSRTALSQHEVTTEVDRYISWPGQALSYKLGELTIRRLRAEAEAKLGDKFDIRNFHDAILETGSLPLSVLEQHIREFIANGGKSPYEGRAGS
ncbi:MAG TPA: DUF885 family protein [Allosphingosinicella sp.]|nr:DUF885 family protein [Allosphingosinicella sp.]